MRVESFNRDLWVAHPCVASIEANADAGNPPERSVKLYGRRIAKIEDRVRNHFFVPDIRRFHLSAVLRSIFLFTLIQMNDAVRGER